MIASETQRNNIQKIKLKKHQLNLILLAYIRHVKQNQFFGKFKAKPQNVLSRVTDLSFELICLKTYLDLVKHFKYLKERETKLEEDLELLAGDIGSGPARMAIVLRSRTKMLIRAQVELCELLVNLVEQAIEL